MLEVKIEQPTEARAGSDVTSRAIVLARGRTRMNQSSSERLVENGSKSTATDDLFKVYPLPKPTVRVELWV